MRLNDFNEGQNAQQKSVRQLPALFKPKDISPVLGQGEKQHPTKGYFVGGESQEKPVVKKRNFVAKNAKMGGAGAHKDKKKAQKQGDVKHKNKELAESITQEDMIGDVARKLGDYLQDVATAVKKDPELLDRMPKSGNEIGPAVKTIKTDDGHEIKIHGTEDDGFRITVKNKPHSAKFESLDHAVMACEMYCNKRRRGAENADYIEERS